MSTLKTRSSLSLFLIGGLCLAPAAVFDIEISDAPIDVVGYVIDIDLRPLALAFTATAEISFVMRQALERVAFDLVGLTVDSVKVDDSPVTFSRDGDKLVVELGGARLQARRWR